MVAKWPVVPLYTDKSCTHLADEALFGEVLVPLKKEPEDLVFVLTENQYYGFVNADALGEECYDGVEYHIISPMADILPQANFDTLALFTLPRFARVCVKGREGAFFAICLPGEKTGYVFSAHAEKEFSKATPDSVCDTALSFLGTPYRFGGKSSFGMDCSGLVCLCFNAHGVRIPRDTALMRDLFEKEKKEACRGDLVLFERHVGILLTNERFVHASAAAGHVLISSLNPADPLFDAQHVASGYSIRSIEYPSSEGSVF